MMKGFLLILFLVFSTHLLANEQKKDAPNLEKKTPVIAPAQMSGLAGAENPANKKQNVKKPNMAEYCRKHTC